MTFVDSHCFEVTDDGRALHKRVGDTYADKTINGVNLDDSCRWMNEIDEVQQEISTPSGESIIIGERRTNDEVIEISKKWGKDRGEGKFKRQRRVPKKKMKKHPTKPKPTHSWHKRLSKVAIELGDLELQTEEQAHNEISACYEQREEEKEIKEEQEAEQYLYEWCELIDKKPGEFRVVEVCSPISGITGQEVFDIDIAGVNRTPALLKNAFWTEWWKNNKTLPTRVARRYIFTYWDENSKMYRYNPLSQLDMIDLDGDKHNRHQDLSYIHILNGYPRVTGKMVDRWLDIMTEDSIYPEMGGIKWNEIWMKMDFMRTGMIRKNVYYEGDRSRCFLVGTSIPNMTFDEDKDSFERIQTREYDHLREESDDDYYNYM